MLKLLITGICGKMGGTALKICQSCGAEAVCGVDIAATNLKPPVYSSFEEVGEEVDAVIDFSSPSAIYGELEWAESRHVPVIIAATGYTDREREYIRLRSEKNALFISPNYSLGIAVLKKLAREAAKILGENFDVEIIEKHHRLKADAPSGTAISLAESIGEVMGGKPYVCGHGGKRGGEIGIHSVRGGTITGEHEIIFAGGGEIIALSHTALSKDIFAAGAIEAAKWIQGKPPALYGFEDMTNTF